MQLPKLSSPPPDFLTSMEAYVAEAPRPVAADGEAPAPAKVGTAGLQLHGWQGRVLRLPSKFAGRVQEVGQLWSGGDLGWGGAVAAGGVLSSHTSV